MEIDDEAIENARELADFSMMVTSEIHMPSFEIYAAYHNLWRIEESFRVMKSQLDARPVYLQKKKPSLDIFSYDISLYCWQGFCGYMS